MSDDRRLVLVLDGLDEAAIARRRILDWLQQWLQLFGQQFCIELLEHVRCLLSTLRPRANGHRCICSIIASRPSGTNQPGSQHAFGRPKDSELSSELLSILG